MIRGHTTWLVVSFAIHATVSTAQDTPASAPAVNFTVADERAEPDKKQKMLSYAITSCDYGVQRLGDKKTPDRIGALHDDLVALKGAALEGKTLKVSRYHIYFNNSAVLRGMVYPQYTGLIPELMKEHGTNCPREKAGGGWFDLSELTGPYSPLILDVEANLDGVPHSVRVVFTPPRQLPGNFKKPEDATDLLAAMRKAAEALGGQLP
jgi:hypothetical protein